ncbi:hypothetical protein [Pseudorhodoferax sp. Leaf274]|uniref:hypothetical protein n=1 Tax=Pseudorhodoferax sp. Leaf274 TaxID=1736318 RepID=UPI0007037496|nr:hypothetical protein [Pseudorhodoferax sp. Leaf274]KQP36106.1 hypothetical protein ASF44_16180 [Pseudorhodoferax sp. Leaf274]
MQPLPRNFQEEERDRFWARKLKEHEMYDLTEPVPLVARRVGEIDFSSGAQQIQLHMSQKQIRDAAATLLQCMKPEARALLLEQIKEAA